MSREILAQALQESRPIVLLLGQRALALDTGKDPILQDAQRRLGEESDEAPRDYRDLIARTEAGSTEFFDWLAARAERLPAPEWMNIAAGVPWNGVFTSCIDSSLVKAMRTSWRIVEPVVSVDHVPRDPRSRTTLHVSFLFGRLAVAAGDERAPRSLQELRTRRARHAIPLLNRLPDTVSPFGLLVLEGFDPRSDWLDADDLAGVLDGLQANQVLWFGFSKEILPRAGIDDFIAKGVIRTWPETLGSVLQSLVSEGAIALGVPPANSAQERVITLKDRSFEVPAQIWLNTATTTTILDDSHLSKPDPMSADRAYVEFRRFLGSMDDDATALVNGIKQGFAIKRRWENRLRTIVRSALRSPAQTVHPLVLHGQSGAGKSVALARLAIDIRSEGEFPVALSTHSSRVPSANELDAFCQLAEENGASATLIVVDANAEIGRYEQLRKTLASRGRNAVVVGSSYASEDALNAEREKASGSFSLFTYADPILSIEEFADLRALVKNFAPELQPENWNAIGLDHAEHFLPLLYRLLPETRFKIGLGLSREAAVTEDELRRRGREKIVRDELGTLGEALVNAGVGKTAQLLDDRVSEIAREAMDAAGQIVAFVMVPGRLGLAQPVELLLRTVGGQGVGKIVELFRGIDLFRWLEDANGEILVKPRLMLEARLICDRRLAGVDGEIDCALQILSNVRGAFDPQNAELRFALDFVRALGSNGPDAGRYSRHYLRIADQLERLRERNGVVSPPLMLQEAMLRREFIKASTVEGTPALPQREEILLTSIRTLEKALDLGPQPSSVSGKRFRANVYVELATTFGFLADTASDEEKPVEQVLAYYDKMKTWAARARALDVSNYYPLDVCLWSARDLLQDDRLDTEAELELQADVFDVLDDVDETALDAKQFLRFQQTKQTVALALGDVELEDEAFAQLAARGSAAGYLIRARKVLGQIAQSSPIDDQTAARAQKALAYLREHWESIGADPRCIRLMLRAWWLMTTRSQMLRGQRQPIPQVAETLTEGLELIERLIEINGTSSSAHDRFVAAALNWTLERYQRATELWRDVARETDFSNERRVVRHLTLADASLRPITFTGQVRTIDPDGRRGRIFVEEIRKEIAFLPKDFGSLEVRRGTAVPEFFISFNYIGPIADSTRPARRGKHER